VDQSEGREFKTSTTPKKKKKLDVLAHTYHFSYTGNINRRTVVQASLGIEETLYLKNNESKKG
jgi:hypothetical protein